MRRLAFFVAMSACLSGGFANAQQDDPERPPEPVPAAPYEAELLRLSEILGAVHYLRALCAPDAQSIWRRHMAELIETERPAPDLEVRMVGRFNTSYETFSLTYRTCTDAASLSRERYIREGATLSRSIADRYGGS